MATSPSDQNKRNVLSWLDRLQSSVRDAGSSAGPDIFTELRNREEVESDCASDTPNIEFADEELERDGDNSKTEITEYSPRYASTTGTDCQIEH